MYFIFTIGNIKWDNLQHFIIYNMLQYAFAPHTTLYSENLI